MPKAAAILAVALVAIGIAGEDAAAELLSSRPITIVIPFTPGASADTIQRIVAKKVTENTGQTIVVESRAGGGGAIGAAAVKQAPPDGHMLFQANAGTHAANVSLYPTLSYDPIKDFRPITLMWSFPQLLSVPLDSPAKSVADLVALAKSKPGGLSFASQGSGSGGHLLGRNAQGQDRREHGPHSLPRRGPRRARSCHRPGGLLLRLLFVGAVVSAGGQGACARGDIAETSADPAGYSHNEGGGVCRYRARRMVRPGRAGRNTRPGDRQAQCRVRAGGTGSGHHAGRSWSRAPSRPAIRRPSSRRSSRRKPSASARSCARPARKGSERRTVGIFGSSLDFKVRWAGYSAMPEHVRGPSAFLNWQPARDADAVHVPRFAFQPFPPIQRETGALR